MRFLIRSERPWLYRLAVAGNTARGFVYIVAGATAMHAALRARESDADLRGALGVIRDAPLGQTVLWVIAAGLAMYALWRLFDAILDARGKGTELKGLVQRAAGIVVAAIYISLALGAARLAGGTGSAGGGGDGPRKGAALLLEQPFGQWLAGIVGLVIVGLGLFRVRKAFTADFGEFDSQWLRGLARYGYGARGTLFVVAGGFMIAAAVYRSAGQARGLGGAVQFISEQPAGPLLLLAVGAGLLLYGLTTAIEAFVLYGRRT